MQINAFVYLPETAEGVKSALSVVSSHDDLFLEINRVSKIFYEKLDLSLYYFESNVINFFSACKSVGVDSIEQKRGVLRATWLHRAKEAYCTDKREGDCLYYHWRSSPTLGIDYAQNPFSDIAESCFQNDAGKVVIINFDKSLLDNDGKFFVFKYAQHKKELPDRFVHIDCVVSSLTLQGWLEINYKRRFSLDDVARFVKTTRVCQGQPVYIEKNTGRYWYLDNMHKDHYEVFDSNRNHMAISDLDGTLHPKSAIKGRKL